MLVKKLMGATIFGLLAMVISLGTAADINKCRGADGKLYYTDNKCPGGSSLEESITSKANSTETQKPETIEFSGSIYEQFSKAKSLITTAEIHGQTCEWGIKVKNNILDCAQFIGMMGEDGPYAQSMNKIAHLISQDQNKEISSSEYQEVIKAGKRIVDYRNLMLSYAGIR